LRKEISLLNTKEDVLRKEKLLFENGKRRKDDLRKKKLLFENGE
jgi:hypothetical protein